MADGPQAILMPVQPALSDRTRSPAVRGFWQAMEAGRLVAQRCGGCGSLFAVPAVRCANCRSDVLDFMDLSGAGTVHSWSIPRRPRITGLFSGTDRVALLVNMEEGIRVLGLLAQDSAPVEFGSKVVGEITMPAGWPVPQFRAVGNG